jgi:hypothetical protein
VVDRSLESTLESVAADRGITICFADLDGAAGLWLPEERTILLARGLSSRQAADVLEHELSHVDIEDGHAALDATMHRRLGRARWTVAGTAAASLATLIGISIQLPSRPAADSHPVPPVAVAPSPTAAGPRPVPTSTPPTRVVLIDGQVRTQTVTVTPSIPASRATTPAATRAASAGSTSAAPTKTRVATATATGTQAGLGTTTPPALTTDPPADTGSPTPSLTAAGTSAAIKLSGLHQAPRR